MAATSAPAPPVLGASCAITSRPVRRTDSRIVSESSGFTPRGSITSTLIPSAASCSAASSARCIRVVHATTVTWVPARATAACPISTRCSPSGTSPLSPYRPLCSRKSTGLSERIALLSRPLASAGVDGVTTCSPAADISIASGLCECSGPPPLAAPSGARMTSGTVKSPPCMYRHFAALL
ncbi:unannotated protein [freshwater metagenome]|uniref:Unannotated protein n=1 Tax=freshwater metagenome TaxID=449393 RepID=A0A6J7PV98_9ZZZZ